MILRHSPKGACCPDLSKVLLSVCSFPVQFLFHNHLSTAQLGLGSLTAQKPLCSLMTAKKVRLLQSDAAALHMLAWFQSCHPSATPFPYPVIKSTSTIFHSLPWLSNLCAWNHFPYPQERPIRIYQNLKDTVIINVLLLQSFFLKLWKLLSEPPGIYAVLGLPSFAVCRLLEGGN